MTTIHFIVSGRVQGVSFRANTQSQALHVGLRGWVRNLFDGRVEGKACGDEQAIAQFKDWLQKGPILARVDALDIQTSSEEPFDGFEIRWDGELES